MPKSSPKRNKKNKTRRRRMKKKNRNQKKKIKKISKRILSKIQLKTKLTMSLKSKNKRKRKNNLHSLKITTWNLSIIKRRLSRTLMSQVSKSHLRNSPAIIKKRKQVTMTTNSNSKPMMNLPNMKSS